MIRASGRRGNITEMDDSSLQCEYSVEADVSPEFAWSWWTDVRNWADPPAEFSLEGPFAAGSWGTTRMPGQEPLRWLIAEVEPGKSSRIEGQLDRAVMSSQWWFEALPDGRTKLTQRIQFEGENAGAYADAREMFQKNMPDGMKRIAAMMSRR
jgi:hypothetical protein